MSGPRVEPAIRPAGKQYRLNRLSSNATATVAEWISAR